MAKICLCDVTWHLIVFNSYNILILDLYMSVGKPLVEIITYIHHSFIEMADQ